MIEFFGSSWTQLVLWAFAGGMAIYFRSFMAGSSIAWTIIASGVLLIGIRIAYKLLPFYEQTQALRYIIGIIGIIVLFTGLIKYCNSTKRLTGRG